MKISIIGTGFIGSTLGTALTASGHKVTYGSRHQSKEGALEAHSNVASIGSALEDAEVVILALPGSAVADLTKDFGELLDSRLVIDATNQMGADVANARSSLPGSIRYARAFNTLGGENMANPEFADGPTDMFFSAPEGDRITVETVIDGVGLRPVFVGEDQEAIIDALFQLWIALAITQGRGRRLALRLMEG